MIEPCHGHPKNANSWVLDFSVQNTPRKWHHFLARGLEDYPTGAAAFYHACHYNEYSDYCALDALDLAGKCWEHLHRMRKYCWKCSGSLATQREGVLLTTNKSPIWIENKRDAAASSVCLMIKIWRAEMVFIQILLFFRFVALKNAFL